MDYKFLLLLRQEAAGSDNAKVNITINGTQVATDLEISQTSANGTVTCHGEKFQPVVVEGTGLTATANPATSVTQTITISYTNDYFVDSDTDRNIEMCNVLYYTDKANGSDYKRVDTSGADVEDDTGEVITDFTDMSKMIETSVSSVSGAISDWTSGYVQMSVNGDYTITFATPNSTGRNGKYPGDAGYTD